MTNPLIENKFDRPAIDVMGERYTVLLSSEETGNAYSLFEFQVRKGEGTPPHIHTLEDESFYIISGEVDFMIDGKVTRAKSGDIVFGPRGVPHNFTGASDTPARVIFMTSPGGFEKFFTAVGVPVADKSVPAKPPTDADVQRLMEIAPKFGLKILT